MDTFNERRLISISLLNRRNSRDNIAKTSQFIYYFFDLRKNFRLFVAFLIFLCFTSFFIYLIFGKGRLKNIEETNSITQNGHNVK